MVGYPGLAHQIAVPNDGTGHALRRPCDKEEHDAAGNQVNGVVRNRALEHFRKNEVHDQHHQQWIEHRPQVAQYAAAVLLFQVSADQVLQQGKIFNGVCNGAFKIDV